MEENKAVIGALIFIVLVVGANFIMYAIARGATRPGGGALDALAKSLFTRPANKKDDMDELRRRIETLDKGADESGKESE